MKAATMLRALLAAALLLPQLARPVDWAAVAEEFPYCSKNVAGNYIRPPAEEELARVESIEQVQFLFRHGQRTAVRTHCYGQAWECKAKTDHVAVLSDADNGQDSFPRIIKKIYTDPNILPGDCQFGQIMPDAWEQHAQNGHNLFDAYINADGADKMRVFDPEQVPALTSDDVYLFSTDFQRTLTSLQILLSAMFPASGDSLETIPVHTRDMDKDYVHENPTDCPAIGKVSFADEEVNKRFKTMFADEWDEFSAFREEFKAAVNETYTEASMDCQLAVLCAGMQMPERETEELFRKVANYSFRAYAWDYKNEKDSKLAMGPLVRDMLDKWEARRNGTAGAPKMVMWSAHDTTIMTVLEALELWDGYFPDYATVLTFEYYKMTDQTYGFRITNKGRPIAYPGCDTEICPLDMLMEQTSTWAMSYEERAPLCADPEGQCAAAQRTADKECADAGGYNTGDIRFSPVTFSLSIVGILLVGLLLGHFGSKFMCCCRRDEASYAHFQGDR